MAQTSRSIHDSLYRALVEGLRAARQRSGLRQEDIAATIGMTQSMYSKIERSERRVDLLEFVLIARAISADPAKLLKGMLSEAEELQAATASRTKAKRRM